VVISFKRVFMLVPNAQSRHVKFSGGSMGRRLGQLPRASREEAAIEQKVCIN